MTSSVSIESTSPHASYHSFSDDEGSSGDQSGVHVASETGIENEDYDPAWADVQYPDELKPSRSTTSETGIEYEDYEDRRARVQYHTDELKPSRSATREREYTPRQRRPVRRQRDPPITIDDHENPGPDSSDDEVDSSDELYTPSESTDPEYSFLDPPDRRARNTASSNPRIRRRTFSNNSPDYYPDVPLPGRPSWAGQSPERVRNSYAPPKNVEDPLRSLSVTVSLRSTNGEQWTDVNHPMARPWMQARSALARGSKTEYLVIRAADHYAEDVDDSMITLDLVLHCPHVDSSLKSVALALLRDRRHPPGLSSVEGAPREYINRYDYRDNHGVWNGQSVTFINVPFFTMKKRSQLVPGQTTSNAAVPIRYHTYRDHGIIDWDISTSSTRSSFIGADSGDELCVTYLWCLLLGSDTIVTCGDISISDLLASSVTIDKKSNARQPCAIRIVDPDSRYFYLVIELPLPYFEFMKHASNIARLPNEKTTNANFKLLTEDHDLLTPERWVDLMEREDLVSLQLLLIRNGAYSDESDDSDDEIRTVKTHRSNQRLFKRGNDSTGKVVNDVQNVLHSKHYIIDSASETEGSGAEVADRAQQTTAEKPVGTNSSFSSKPSKPKAPSFTKAGSNRERGVHFADDIRVCESEDTIPVESIGSLDPPPSASEPLVTHPFFTWNVVSYSTTRASDGQSHVKVYHLLNQVDKAMGRKRQRIHKYLYRRGFECTLQELERRHPYLMSSPTQLPETGKDRPDGTGGCPDGAKGEIFHTILEGSHDMEAARHRIAWDGIVRDNLRPLLSLSKAIAQTFVPADMEVVHRCWKKLWGSLDRILRCIEIHYKLSHESAEYIVNSKMLSSFAVTDVLGNTEEGALSCVDCEGGTRYNNLQKALDHLHEKHSQCRSCDKSKRFYDDPCTVWVKVTMFGKRRKVLDSLSDRLSRLREFVQYLESLQRCVMDLQFSVQYAGNNGIDQDVTSRLPFLPSILVRGFEEFLLSSISLAHYLSRSGFSGRVLTLKRHFPRHESSHNPSQYSSYSRANSSARTGSRYSNTYGDSNGTPGSFSYSLSDVIDTQSCSMREATSRLKQARRDLVLLSTTTSQTGSVKLTSIGPEFLMTIILSNLNTHVNGKKTNLIQMYNRRMMKIANKTTTNPQRRLFLELYGLEDDVSAIRNVMWQQRTALANYDRVLDPNSFRVTTKARRTLYEVEHDFIEKEQTRLDVQIMQSGNLLRGVGYYRDRIKQHIEIMEEGHGKAIRVFTFVTAFFLPLSFCTSFMGMNTTDIRDTNFDQTIFWEIAIPLTIVIVTLAFLYGYKWDDIYEYGIEWREERSRKRAQKRARKLAEKYKEGDEQPRWQVLGEKLKMGRRRILRPGKNWKHDSGAFA
ncbi:Mg2+ transporter protein CorA-like/Zinc transport protein ZntB [Penicillium vulpinum]|uniref:Mg2+ transporter protein CorA-like/Zinc transport protein ZntB n=1 Tax=Penicillium vulpinum TaxID=29845 RepID=UPI002547F5CE|nr:Mg2+ transporter protein CorA-like/Zinc transport protein ZntB [Penicillium vulpinum]KAJ5959242.1 Mg2+ transporter protein CorA-like/Zinc transport protein ZntB [Penicillium vulpinum]